MVMLMMMGLGVEAPVSNAFHIHAFFFSMTENKLLLQRQENTPFYSAKIKITATESSNGRKFFFRFSLISI